MGALKPHRSFLAALACAVVVAGAWLLVDRSSPVVPETASLQAAKAPPAAQTQHTQDVAAWTATSLSRPLFSRHRRPPATPRVLTAAESQPVPPRLTAVLVGPFGSSAVFVPGGSNRTVTVQEGDKVGLYSIRRISPGEVLVDAPGGERLLRPAFNGAIDRQLGAPGRATGPSPQRLAARP
jgi:hypothetical protein